MSDFLDLIGFKSIILFLSTGFSILLIMLAVGIIDADDIVAVFGLCNDYVNNPNSVVPDKFGELAQSKGVDECPSKQTIQNLIDNLNGAVQSILAVLDSLAQKLLNWTDGGNNN